MLNKRHAEGTDGYSTSEWMDSRLGWDFKWELKVHLIMGLCPRND